jgi:hypothetical protein
MDILKIVTEEIEKTIKSGTMEKLIRESISKSIDSAIKETYGSYSFKRKIEEKLSKDIDTCLDTIPFDTYREIMLKQMVMVIEELSGKEFAERSKLVFEEWFNGETFKSVSEMFEDFRNYHLDTDYDAAEDEFTLIIEKSDGSFIYYYFDQTPGTAKRDCDYAVGIFKTGSGDHIFSCKIEGNDYAKMPVAMGTLNKFDTKLLSSYFKRKPIDVDVDDAYDVDKTLYEERD